MYFKTLKLLYLAICIGELSGILAEPGNARKLYASIASPRSRSLLRPSFKVRLVATVSNSSNFASLVMDTQFFGGHRETGEDAGKTMVSSFSQFLLAGGKSGIHPNLSSISALFGKSEGTTVII